MDAPAPAPVLSDSPPAATDAARPIVWPLLEELATDPGFDPSDYGPAKDFKPWGFTARLFVRRDPPRCAGCGARWPGGVVCGVCRNRVRRLRDERGGRGVVVAADAVMRGLVAPGEAA